MSFVSANGRGHSRFHFVEMETEAWQGGGLPELRTVVVDKDMNSELNDFPFEDRWFKCFSTRFFLFLVLPYLHMGS